MAVKTPPTQSPTANELLNAPIVIQAMAQAWIDSRAGDPTQRHEEGGWIYMNLTTGDFLVQRAMAGRSASLNLSVPPIVPGAIVVGKFHTHPNPSAEGWHPGPSDVDRSVDDLHGVPDLIQADDGIHLSGPATRRGGLGGGPGFPL